LNSGRTTVQQHRGGAEWAEGRGGLRSCGGHADAADGGGKNVGRGQRRRRGRRPNREGRYGAQGGGLVGQVRRAESSEAEHMTTSIISKPAPHTAPGGGRDGSAATAPLHLRLRASAAALGRCGLPACGLQLVAPAAPGCPSREGPRGGGGGERTANTPHRLTQQRASSASSGRADERRRAGMNALVERRDGRRVHTRPGPVRCPVNPTTGRSPLCNTSGEAMTA
jgi:hypothetical protein